jgi:hypothetical protein
MIISGLSLPTAMKMRTLLIAVALCFTAATSGFCANPQVGTWKLNEAKSTFTPGMGKNTTVVFTDLGGGVWQVVTTIIRVNKNGKRTEPRTTTWTGKRDGKPHPVIGSRTYDEIAYTEDGFTAFKGHKEVMKGTINYSLDGKSRVVTANGTTVSGKKLASTAKYDKQ